MRPCLALSNIRYVSRVKWSNLGKGVTLSPTSRCSSYRKGSLWVALFTYLYSLQLSRDLQQFLFFVDYGYAHVSLLCFPLVMLFVPHWLLAQAHLCGQTHLPPSPNSTTSIGQGDILLITLLILSSVGCSCINIRQYIAPVGMVTFWQSPCWYSPRPDAAVSTSTDT